MFKMGNGVVWQRWAPLPLRLIIGYGFVAHGWAKLSRGPAGFAKLLEQIGAPLPEVTAWASTLIEILGGLAILCRRLRRGREYSADRHDARGDVHRPSALRLQRHQHHWVDS